MTRKTALVKISGDLLSKDKEFADRNRRVVSFIKFLTREFFVVICTGGGVQINKEFEARGFGRNYGPFGRETRSFEERQLARDILERNQAELQDLFASENIGVTVLIPVLDIGSVLCHVNGDIFVQAAYLGFDKIYVLTLEDRVPEKTAYFEKYPKIEVVGFSEKES